MRRLIAGAVLVTVLLGACGSSEKHDPTAGATSPAPAAATDESVDAGAGAPTSAAPAAQPAGRLDPVPQAVADVSARLGIELGGSYTTGPTYDGRTANDAGDADTGPAGPGAHEPGLATTALTGRGEPGLT